MNSVGAIPISRERLLQKSESVNDVEMRQLRGAIGQLNWLSCVSRPDISFSVCEASSTLKRATVKSIVHVNKILKRVKSDVSSISVPVFKSLSDLKLCVYSDASFANLPDGGSQGGHIVFLTDSDDNSCPLSWHSTKVKRMVKSTLAAETLALVDGSENAFLLSKLLAEIIHNKRDLHLPIECRTDNKSLFQAAYSLKAISDKRLRIELSLVREMLERKEMELVWVEAKHQLADVLTKGGASGLPLLKVLQDGCLSL